MPNGFPYAYQFDQSISNKRYFSFFILILIEHSVKQIVETLIRRRVLWRLIWVCTICLHPTKRTQGLYGLSHERILQRAVHRPSSSRGPIASRVESVPVFRRKNIATCDFPGGSGPPVLSPPPAGSARVHAYPSIHYRKKEIPFQNVPEE